MSHHHIIPPGSLLWIQASITSLVAVTGLLLLSKHSIPDRRKAIAASIGVILLATELLMQVYLLWLDRWSVQESLPLHLCTLSAYVCAFALLSRKQLAFEIAVYWGVPSGLHSILTPELTHGMDAFLLFEYYVLHCGIFLSGLLLSMDMQLRRQSWLRAFLLTNAAAAIASIADMLSGANYMYLVQKPIADNPFIVGAWPWYILSLEFIASAHFFLLYALLYRPLRKQIVFYCMAVLKLAAALVAMIVQLPLIAGSYVLYRHKVREHRISSDPVFILGHWRSGTTRLHSLLVKASGAGYINFYKALFPGHCLLTERFLKTPLSQVFRKLNIHLPFFNKIPFDFDYPCEEDTALVGELSTKSAYWAYAFPRMAVRWFGKTIFLKGESKRSWQRSYHRFVQKMSYANGGKALLLKSPGNTSRVRALLELFPNASFVYIHRDPCDVYYSHFKLWRSSIRQYGLQSISDAALMEIIIDTFNKMVAEFENSKDFIAGNKLITVSYQELMAQPEVVTEHICRAFALDRVTHEDTRTAETYEPFRYERDRAVCDTIKQRTEKFRQTYGYV